MSEAGASRWRIRPLLLVCMRSMVIDARAQQASAPLSTASPARPAPSTEIQTLGQVQALRPDEDVLDRDRFENPIVVDPNRFDQAYDTGLAPEQVAIDHGGYLDYGINAGLYETWKGFKKVTGMRPQSQSAIARPPPLTEEQARRSVEASEESPAGPELGTPAWAMAWRRTCG